MIRNRDHRRLSRFETLEPKAMLAGDVLVSVVQGALHIEGDTAANNIAITAGAEAKSYVITGLENTSLRLVDPDTDWPGDPVNELNVENIRGNVSVDLGDGDDQFAAAEVHFRGRLNIQTGEGDDQVRIGAEAAVGTALGELLSDDASVAVKGRLRIDTGIGDDLIEVGDAAVYGDLRIRAGDGVDLLSLGGESGGGPGLLDSVLDLPDATLKVYGSIDANLGEGDDQVALVQVKAYGSTHIDTALGDADVDVRLSYFSHLGLDTGDDVDDVELVDSAFALLKVELGDGDDVLATSNVRAKLETILGGEGEDTLSEVADSHIVHQIIRGIEIPAIEDTPIGGGLGHIFGHGGFSWFGRFFSRLFR